MTLGIYGVNKKMSKKDIIAIVGRPNIGKSTLFNRITGQKKAIVSDFSGVTRDRIYQEADWAGRIFTLVDTGGFVPDTKDFFEEKIRLQVEIAIDEADHIIYLLDVETGITAIDNEIATKLKKSNKKITIVVNKVDSEKREPDVMEFYNLGLGEPIGISAMGGRNVGTMLDIVTDDIATEDMDALNEDDNRLKIAIIGKPNVGKSSLTNAFLQENKMIVSDIAGTTRDSVDSLFKYNKEEILLIDTAGIRRKRSVNNNIEYYSIVRALRALDRCDIAILMLDVNQGITKQDLDILNEAVEMQKGLILAFNKWDLYENKNTKSVMEFEKKLKDQLIWIPYIPMKFISVLEKQRLLKLIDLSIEIRNEMKKRISTSKLNDYLLPIIKRTTPPSVNSKFVKIKFVSQVSTDPPIFTFFVNEPTLLKDNYKKFLERKIREKFKFKGVPIKLLFKKKDSVNPFV